MIRGVFYLSTNEEGAQQALSLRKQVFGVERDAHDLMAVYAVTFDSDGTPGGTGRLYLDDNEQFTIDMVGVVEDLRGRYLGDLLMRMLLYRAQELNCASVHIACDGAVKPFFERYGLHVDTQNPEGLFALTALHDEIDIEGTCKHCK